MLLEYFTQIKRMYDNGCAWISPERYHDAEFAARQGIFYLGSTSGLPFIVRGSDIGCTIIRNPPLPMAT